jgi:hypothetical protein
MDAFAKLHALGLSFLVEHEKLPVDRPMDEHDVRAAVEKRNAYWRNDDFDPDQVLNFDLVEAGLALAFLRALPDRPPEVLAEVRAAPLDLATPHMRLRRGFGTSARSLASGFELSRAPPDGRWTVAVAFDPAESARQVRVAIAEEPPRQQALDMLDAELARTPVPEQKVRVARQTALRRLIAIQRARLTLSRSLEAFLGAAGADAHEELTIASLRADTARLVAALANAPAWGTRLPPPPPTR